MTRTELKRRMLQYIPRSSKGREGIFQLRILHRFWAVLFCSRTKGKPFSYAWKKGHLAVTVQITSFVQSSLLFRESFCSRQTPGLSQTWSCERVCSEMKSQNFTVVGAQNRGTAYSNTRFSSDDESIHHNWHEQWIHHNPSTRKYGHSNCSG